DMLAADLCLEVRNLHRIEKDRLFFRQVLQGVARKGIELLAEIAPCSLELILQNIVRDTDPLGHKLRTYAYRFAVNLDTTAFFTGRGVEERLTDSIDQRNAGVEQNARTAVGILAGNRRDRVDYSGDPALSERARGDRIEVGMVNQRHVSWLQA